MLTSSLRGRRPVQALAVVSAATLLLTACGGGGASEEADVRDGALYAGDEEIADAELWEAAQQEGTLVVYSTYSEVLETGLQDAFAEQTGIQVENVRLTGPRMFERIEGEQAAGVLGADVIRRSDLALVRQHEESGVYEAHCPPAWDELIRTNHPDCMWWASNETPYVIGYNEEVVSEDEAPSTWEDLLDARWSDGVMGINNITSGGTTWSRDSWLREQYGVEYWEAMAAQSPLISTSAGSISDLMARGEIEVASVLIGAQGEQIDNGAPLTIVFPEDGVPTSAHYLGLASDSENPNAARVFLNWSASLAGQTAMAEVAGDYAVREDAPPPQAAGITFPSRDEVDLVFTESLEPTEADEKRNDWIQEWLTIFNYTPEG